ncbi:MAG: His/Gly/Thr/Pro-type tRNA ligase C-terminal domain-containing protein, partial [Opitutae bacterium]|nr:His/Gly/Thr/Pro-type tRNA ligase C-terminal domain-containing protein [Opitutae bacterium]
MIMGCYGIGISRTLQAVIEQSNDADGIIWPWFVAPWQVLVVNLDPADAAASALCLQLAQAAESAGADVLIDDRAERPGVKFKDADLIGLPLRLTVGGRGLKEGIFEMKWRTAKEVSKVAIVDAANVITAAVRQAAGQA